MAITSPLFIYSPLSGNILCILPDLLATSCAGRFSEVITIGALIMSGYLKNAAPIRISERTEAIIILPILTIHEGGLESMSLTSSDLISNLRSLDIKLVFNKFVIYTSICNKLFMRALLYHHTSVEDNDIIGIFHGAKAVRNNNNCTAFEKLIEILHNISLILRIESISSFIKYNKFRIFVNGSCNENSLFL